jgi:hypothetical protein
MHSEHPRILDVEAVNVLPVQGLSYRMTEMRFALRIAAIATKR